MNSSKKDIRSHHIFMFPFRFCHTPNEKELRLKEIINIFEKKGWEKKDITTTTGDKYSEYAYFYPFVRRALYNNDDNDEFISTYLERKTCDDSRMIIEIMKKHESSIDGEPPKLKTDKIFELKVTHISLRLFETNVGILTIELQNEKPFTGKDGNGKDISTHDLPSNLEDVLYINDYGRRIFPQFITEYKKNTSTDKINSTNETKLKFLPGKITFQLDKDNIWTEKFEADKYLNNNNIFAEHIEKLLGVDKEVLKKIIPIIDDRMFVLSWYGNNYISNHLKEISADKTLNFENSVDWYKYVFLDSEFPGCDDKVSMYNSIKNSTYREWLNSNTLFGITRYSFVCMTDEGKFGKNIIRKHLYSQYYQIFILLLAQRASIIKYTADIQHISEDIRKPDFGRKSLKNILTLQSDYICFNDRLLLSEVTPQEQGIKLYKMATMILEIKEQASILEKKINELCQFAELKYNENLNTSVSFLNLFTFLFFPLSLLLSFWGMNFYFNKILWSDASLTSNPLFSIVMGILSLLILIVSVFFTHSIFHELIKSHKIENIKTEDISFKILLKCFNWKNRLMLIFIVLLYLIVFLLVKETDVRILWAYLKLWIAQL